VKHTLKHTPGPWEQDADTIIKFLGEDANGPHIQQICEITYAHDPEESTKEAEANALLIAAAPELLEALEAMIRYGEDGPAKRETGYEIEMRAKAAIRKAKGGS
jgi:hypothetical protein